MAGSNEDSLIKRLGPGLITGASDDDPSGIGTYSQAGAQLGFGVSWTMLLTYPLMVAIQEISGRIGRVTGHCRERMPQFSSAVYLVSHRPASCRQHDQYRRRSRGDG